VNINKKKKIALFGFSANPPHNAHFEAAEIALRELGVDEVWLIPTGDHHFKNKLWPKIHRWQMTKLITHPPSIRACNIEIKKKGTSYAVDTMRELRKKYPTYEFIWVVGSDIVCDKNYLTWKDWNKLSRLIPFAVVLRPGYLLEGKDVSSEFKILSKVSFNLSSTEIREKLGYGESIHGLVPSQIEEYLKKNYIKSWQSPAT